MRPAIIIPIILIGTVIYFLIIAYAITQIKPDYFTKKTKEKKKHSPFWWIGKIVKNIIGVSLIIAGLIMLVLPGQGLLTIFIGLLFMDFPGKRHLERYLIKQPSIRKSINWVRAKANKPPITLS